MSLLYAPLLLQLPEGIKGAASATAAVQKAAVAEGAMAVVFFWASLVLLLIVIALGMALVKVLTGSNAAIEAACKVRLDGYLKAELELKAKHATEIAINEANHQNVLKGIQGSLNESNIERRALTERINGMARDMAELFDTFAGKINTFAELQASQVARLETMRVEILLEITRLFNPRK